MDFNIIHKDGLDFNYEMESIFNSSQMPIIISLFWNKNNSLDLCRISNFDNYLAIARTGSLKINIKNPIYIKKKLFDTYELVEIINKYFLVFSKPFDYDLALKILVQQKISSLEIEINRLMESKKRFENYI